MKTAHLARVGVSLALLAISPPLVTNALAVGVPAPPPHSQFDPVIVGSNTGTLRLVQPSTIVGYNVFVKDALNALIPSALVKLDFSNSPIRGYTTQNAGTTVDCVNHTINQIAITGHAQFGVRTARFVNTPVVGIVANDGVGSGDVSLGLVPARSTDIDGIGNTTGLADLAYFSSFYIGGPCGAGHPEVDFNNSGGCLSLADFAIFATEYLSGATSAYCW